MGISFKGFVRVDEEKDMDKAVGQVQDIIDSENDF